MILSADRRRKERMMARYIDAEDFFDTFPEIDKIPYSSWAVTHIAAQPEIIRCKDCKWWDKYSEKHGYCMAAKHGFMSSHWEISIYRTYDEDFFCADAEPKEKKGGIDEQND